MSATVLIVEDEKHTREGLCQALSAAYTVYVARNADEAFALLDKESVDVVLTDLRMSGPSGMKVIDYCLKRSNRPICIMMTAYGNVETAVQAMKRGAFDFLTKPINLEKLEIIIDRALKSRHLEKENAQLHERLDRKYNFQGVIGNSEAFKRVLDQVKQVADTLATVLLTGDTGTGKELIAQMIHQNSSRSRHPLVPVNCAALPSNLLESELFGYEKGAFTGATERHIGRFEAAHNGTLFLDEIGEIDASTQVKLLRFLESKTFERLGSTKPITVDTRLICATNRNLEERVQSGDFREDLYYRLNVIPIHLPSLRERADDIPFLLEHYIQQFSAHHNSPLVTLSKAVFEILQAYTWPGNIRELRNFCENIVVMHRGKELTVSDLDSKFHKPASALKTASPQLSTSTPIPLTKEDHEKQLLQNALTQAKGNRTAAAALLNISRRTLHRKLHQWPELEEIGK